MAARKARFSAGLTDWSTLEAAHPAKFDIGQRGGRQANPCALPLARGGARAKAFAKPLSPSLSEPVTLLTCSLNHSLAPSLSTLLLFPLSSFPPSTLPRGFRRTSGTLAAWRRRGLRAIWVTIPSQFLLFFSFFLLLPFLFFFFCFYSFPFKKISQAPESANLNPPLSRLLPRSRATHDASNNLLDQSSATMERNYGRDYGYTVDIRVQPRENDSRVRMNLVFSIIFPPRYRQCPGYPIHRMFSCNNNSNGWRYPQDWKRWTAYSSRVPSAWREREWGRTGKKSNSDRGMEKEGEESGIGGEQ